MFKPHKEHIATIGIESTFNWYWLVDGLQDHGYVRRWTDWPWSSATEYLSQTNPAEAKRIWHDYPLGDYGKGWDDAQM